jgi:multidrug resistance protein, MATE family
MRSFFDALGATRVSMSVILLAAPINVLLNYLLIYGHWGFPELGGAGAGYASAITYWLVFFIACAIAWRWGSFVDYKLFVQWGKISFVKWKEILFIGVPIGISIFVEVSIFSAVTLLMANYSTAVISAHQIALNFTSLLYMIPLSISMGATILVGQEVGAGRMRDAKQYSYLSVGLAILFSFISITILLLFREQIASIYTNDINIVNLSVHFFIYAAIFQLSDAIQAPVQGALRGYKDVNVTFIMAIVSYWVIGLPVGYVMATYTELGPYGYWIGLIAGLTVGAITLAIRLRYIQKNNA